MTPSDLRRVLVVDDDAALVRMIRLSFVTEGFDVLTANDGLQGLEVLDKERVDAIVLDLQMPHMDGRAFYRELRARGSEVPVIIVSAYGALDAKTELKANASIRKPFDPEILIQEVHKLIDAQASAPSLPPASEKVH